MVDEGSSRSAAKEPQTRATVDALARLALRPDPDAWEALLALHGARIHAVCQRILRDRDLAEDACQETLLQLRDRSDRFRPPREDAERAACHWILRVACNTALQIRRSRQRMKDRENRVAEVADTRPVQSERSDERLEAIQEVLMAMPERQRMPLLLHFYGGLGYEELAQALRCPVGTAKTRVHRSLESLRQRLAYAGLVLPLGLLVDDLGLVGAPTVDGGAADRQDWMNLLDSERVSRFDMTANGGISFMAKLSLGTAAVVLAIGTGLVYSNVAGGEKDGSASPPKPSVVRAKSEAERQVERLSHESFAERQRAFEALKSMGARAGDALRKGMQTKDLDVRKRCTELLFAVESAEIKRRVQWVYRSEGGSLTPPAWNGQGVVFQARDLTNTLCVDARSGKLKWRYASQQAYPSGYASIIPAGNKFLVPVSTGQEVGLVALDAATGALRWQSKGFVRTFFHGADDAIESRRLFVHAGTADKSYISGIDLDTGKEDWRYEVPGFFVLDALARDGVCLIVATSREGMTLRAVDIESRTERWMRWLERPTDALHFGDGVVYHAGGQILSACPQRMVDTQQYIHAIDLATGKTRWAYVARESDWYSDKLDPTEQGHGTVRIGRGGDRVGHLVEQGGRLYFGANGHLYALDARSGKEDWKFKLEGVSFQTVPWMHPELKKMSAHGPKQMVAPPPISGPAYADGLLYFGSWDGMHAVDAESGYERWRLPTQEPVVHAPVVHDGVLYFACQQGSVDKVRFLHDMDPKKIRYKEIDTLFAVSVREDSYEK